MRPERIAPEIGPHINPLSRREFFDVLRAVVILATLRADDHHPSIAHREKISKLSKSCELRALSGVNLITEPLAYRGEARR